MDALDRFGPELTWFRLGDATWPPTCTAPGALGEGAPLSTVTDEVVGAFDVDARLLPMTDDRSEIVSPPSEDLFR